MPTPNRGRRATLSAIITLTLFAAALAVAPAATAQEAPEVCTDDVPAHEWQQTSTESIWLPTGSIPDLSEGWSPTWETEMDWDTFILYWEWSRSVTGDPVLFPTGQTPDGDGWQRTYDDEGKYVEVEYPCPEQPAAEVEVATEIDVDCDAGEMTTTTTTTTTEYVWNPDAQDWELGAPVEDVQVETESYEGEECPPEPEVVVETSHGPVDCEASTQEVTTTTTTTEYVWNPDTQEWEPGDPEVDVATETVPVIGAPECIDPCLDDPQLCGPPDLCELNPSLEECQEDEGEGEEDEGQEDEGEEEDEDEEDQGSGTSTITVPRDPDAPADEVITTTTTTTTTEPDDEESVVLGTEVEAGAVEPEAPSGAASDGATLPRTGASSLAMLFMGLGFLTGGFSLAQFARRGEG